MINTTLAENIDRANAAFWDELCGSWLAVSLGIKEMTPDNLRRFDDAYFSLYPYLSEYFLRESLQGKKVLEIGLGYGTLGQALAEEECDYHGLDIASGPVAMMRFRSWVDLSGREKFRLARLWIFHLRTRPSSMSTVLAVCIMPVILRDLSLKYIGF